MSFFQIWPSTSGYKVWCPYRVTEILQNGKLLLLIAFAQGRCIFASLLIFVWRSTILMYLYFFSSLKTMNNNFIRVRIQKYLETFGPLPSSICNILDPINWRYLDIFIYYKSRMIFLLDHMLFIISFFYFRELITDWMPMAREGWGRKDRQEGRFFILLRCGKKMLEHILVLLVMALEPCQRTKSSLTYFVSIQWEFSIQYL